MEVLERNYAELEETRKRENMIKEEEYEKLQRKHRVVNEERAIYLAKLQEIDKEMAEMRDRAEQKNDEFEMIDREYKKLQDKHRDAINNEY